MDIHADKISVSTSGEIPFQRFFADGFFHRLVSTLAWTWVVVREGRVRDKDMDRVEVGLGIRIGLGWK